MGRPTALACAAAIALSSALGEGADADRLARQLEPLVTKLMKEQGLPGLALGVVVDGELVYAKGFGVMSLTYESWAA